MIFIIIIQKFYFLIYIKYTIYGLFLFIVILSDKMYIVDVLLIFFYNK